MMIRQQYRGILQAQVITLRLTTGKTSIAIYPYIAEAVVWIRFEKRLKKVREHATF
jgi:hypothetical protein